MTKEVTGVNTTGLKKTILIVMHIKAFGILYTAISSRVQQDTRLKQTPVFHNVNNKFFNIFPGVKSQNENQQPEAR